MQKKGMSFSYENAQNMNWLEKTEADVIFSLGAIFSHVGISECLSFFQENLKSYFRLDKIFAKRVYVLIRKPALLEITFLVSIHY